MIMTIKEVKRKNLLGGNLHRKKARYIGVELTRKGGVLLNGLLERFILQYDLKIEGIYA